MFHSYSKKSSTSAKTEELVLLKVATVEELLADEKRKDLIQHMRELSALNEEQFSRLCLSAIHNFISHCQSLPETTNSYYSQPGGLIDYALNRTEAALNLFKRYVLLGAKGTLSEEQQLWQYALFSAALFIGVGKLQIDYAVQSYDIHGKKVKFWNPLLESLDDIGSLYSYSFLKQADEDLRRRINLLLARSLMPKAGFAWIASEPKVLAAWLALINEDPHAAGTFGAILITADAMAIQRYLNFLFAKQQGVFDTLPKRRSSTFAHDTLDVSKIEKQISDDFRKWLAGAIESGEIVINKNSVFIGQKGLLISTTTFKDFAAKHTEHSWKAVQKAFLSLKLHKLTQTGGFEHPSEKEKPAGVLITKGAVLLPGKMHFYNPNTQKTSVQSLTEVMHNSQVDTVTSSALPILDSKGNWVLEERVPTAKSSFGVSPRG